jgi:hypothetical protein
MASRDKKILLICLVIFVGSYVFHGFVTSVMQIIFYRPPAPRPKPKPAPVAAAPAPKAPEAPPVVAQPKTVPPAKPSPAARMFNGNWRGQSALPGRGMCDLQLEMHARTEGQGFVGYPKLACSTVASLTSADRAKQANAIVNRTDPESAVLEGIAENDAIHFKAVKTIGADSAGCAISTMTVTVFGANRIAVEWEEPTCSGGHILLARMPR